MLLAAGREVVSKTSAYNIRKLSYRVEVGVCDVVYILERFGEFIILTPNFGPKWGFIGTEVQEIIRSISYLR